MSSEVATLRAMANNYHAGNLWDDLDKAACERAADEISALRRENADIQAECDKAHRACGKAFRIGIYHQQHAEAVERRITEELKAEAERVGPLTVEDIQRVIVTIRAGQTAEADYFGELVERARLAAAKATTKFPQPNYVTLKIAEEAGEVVRGAVHYAEKRMEWAEVEGEIVQLLAMLIRFVTEGDEVNGVKPPVRCS